MKHTGGIAVLGIFGPPKTGAERLCQELLEFKDEALLGPTLEGPVMEGVCGILQKQMLKSKERCSKKARLMHRYLGPKRMQNESLFGVF